MIFPALLLAAATPACTVTDGDTIRCGPKAEAGKQTYERIRLTGIDAPEKRGQCRKGRTCAPGDPVASALSLRVAMASKPITIRRLGTDRYGRTLAVVYAGRTNLACHQLRHGHAIYIPRWDNGGIIRKECR
ncbi:MAG: thermonuclease family protein [Blastomonas sp.]